MKLPEIRIKDGWLLRENASEHLHELWGGDSPLANDEWMEQKVNEYRTVWKPHEERIVNGLCDQLSLEFRQNIIDVYIAPWFNAFSDPMVIGVMKTADEFVDTLTHELIHRLLTDNTLVPHDTELIDEWKELFGSHHSFKTLVHIPVHAAHKAIYLDVLKDEKRLERELLSLKDSDDEDYLKAWDYVEETGYKQIISKLNDSYRKLSENI